MVKNYSDSERGNRHYMGYFVLLAARVLLYTSSHRQDNTYHSLCYTSCGALVGMRNSSMGPPHEGSIRQPIAPWAKALTTELHLAPYTSPISIYIYIYIYLLVMWLWHIAISHPLLLEGYHGLCYTSRGALAGMRNRSMGPPWKIDPMTHRIMSVLYWRLFIWWYQSH